VLSSEDYHRGRQEAIVVAITSNTDRLLVGDHLISDWQSAGLLFPSVATGIIRTVKQSMVGHKLGSMSSRDMRAIEGNLRLSLGLS
jgi:mRNA interferase MazF